jgi:hypothetical protein
MIAIPSYELARIQDECERAGVGEDYRRMVAAGTFPRAAAMYALQSAPGTNNTDQRFCQGQRKKMERMPEINRKGMQKIAARAGIETAGKYYMSGLGSYSDPAAWVTCADDVTTVCKKKNLHCEGTVKYNGVDLEPKAPKQRGLAPDIVEKFATRYLASDPALVEKCKKNPQARRELKEMIVERHGPKKKKRT